MAYNLKSLIGSVVNSLINQWEQTSKHQIMNIIFSWTNDSKIR